MSMINRYKMTKLRYANFLITLKKKQEYTSCEIDTKLLNYLRIKNDIRRLEKYEINYLILDNLEIVEKKEFSNNNYIRYIKILYIKELLLKIRINLVNNY